MASRFGISKAGGGGGVCDVRTSISSLSIPCKNPESVAWGGGVGTDVSGF